MLKNKFSWSKFSLKIAVWTFPVFALILSGYLYYDYMQQRGPLLELHFSDAAGVEAGKTTLKFRGLIVGMVEKVSLGEADDVVIMARLERSASSLAVEGSRFIVVQPEVDFGGVKGLETLIKGPYIRVHQGKGEKQKIFQGQVGESSSATVSFIIRTDISDSIDAGDPVTFRGLKVGKIESVSLSTNAQMVELEVGVQKKYAHLVRAKTVFWQNVGVHAKLGLFASEVKVNSLESLFKSGIAFATPDNPGGAVQERAVFQLQKYVPKDWMSWKPKL